MQGVGGCREHPDRLAISPDGERTAIPLMLRDNFGHRIR